MSAPTLVLIHGSAAGAHSWTAVRRALPAGQRVVAPDLLGYGASPAPGDAYDVHEEVAHLERAVAGLPEVHLLAHSLGAMVALHLRAKLGGRVTRLTLVDPVMVSVLREHGEAVALAEMECQYQAFMRALPDAAAAARGFVDHWNGRDAWSRLTPRARTAIEALVPKLRLEMIAMRSDRTPLADLVASPPASQILLGERTLRAPAATALRLAAALNAVVHVVPDAAHMIPLTHPDAVAACV